MARRHPRVARQVGRVHPAEFRPPRLADPARALYQPKAYVERHSHKLQEQVYHVLEGEGLMHIAGEDRVVRKHDFIFLPPGVEHSIANTGLVDLIFLVVTSPVSDDERPAGGG
jgi:mannose-6-phosphate isomerase-like protein (cupin superfamily)